MHYFTVTPPPDSLLGRPAYPVVVVVVSRRALLLIEWCGLRARSPSSLMNDGRGEGLRWEHELEIIH